jgi:hypothetical protein
VSGECINLIKAGGVCGVVRLHLPPIGKMKIGGRRNLASTCVITWLVSSLAQCCAARLESRPAATKCIYAIRKALEVDSS